MQQSLQTSPDRRPIGQSQNYIAGPSIQTRQNDQVFNTPEEYLGAITTTLDLQENILLQSIYKALSNNYMSVLILKLDKPTLQREYGENVALLRCYHDQKKFFEMPLPYLPQFIDIYDSVVAWTPGAVSGDENQKKIFYAIDVGRKENIRRQIQKKEGEAQPRKYEHEFEPEEDGELIGFKLGHHSSPQDGNLKAVFWSRKKMYRFPFNTQQDENEDIYSKNKGYIIFDDIEKEDIYQIYDFGVREYSSNDYDTDIPEVVLLTDQQQNIHILKGSNYGRRFSKYIQYPSDIEESDKNNVPIQNIMELSLVSTYKIVGIIEKVSKGKAQIISCIQIFEFDVFNEDLPAPSMTREYEIVPDKLDQAVQTFKLNVIFDNLNKKFYVRDFSGMIDQVQLLDINNNVTNIAETIYLNRQVAMNIVANNISLTDRKSPVGLVYTDFICADNLLILLHGKVLTCFDLMDKNKKFAHTRLYASETSQKQNDYYDMGDEAVAVWLMDKVVVNTSQRWKIIVAFENGEVKELIIKSNRYQSIIALSNYLLDTDRKPTRLPGRLSQIIRNRNEINIPMYFTTEVDGIRKLGTIEFWSKTYRYFDIPGINDEDCDNVTYAMLGINDSRKVWQELICIVTKADASSDFLEQRLLHVKIRIGQYQIDKAKEVVILNKEDLPNEMTNVLLARDIFVNGQIIYFVYSDRVELYNMAENSVIIQSTRASIQRLLAFGNRYFYWRQSLGGISENRYQNKIYFDGCELFNQFGEQSDNEDIQLFQGIFPHLNKLQYDTMSESIACFTSFYEIKVFPMLHLPRIKVKIQGNKEDDFHTIATKMVAEYAFCILQNDNYISAWNIKTGKYMLKGRMLTREEGDFSNFVFHQRINDSLTLLRSRRPIFEDPQEAAGSFHPAYDMTNTSDENKKIQMYRYKIIEIQCEKDINISALQANSIRVVTHKRFIGPHYQDTIRVNFGLYSSDDMDLFAFFYKNSQEKMQLKYCRIIDVEFKDETDPETYYYLQYQWKAETEHARLSIHSPDFKNIMVNTGIRDYEILDSSEMMSTICKLPRNLNQHSVEMPNFLSNTKVLFMTEDKIIKCYNFLDTEKREDFITSHCHFPGATDRINLATMLRVNNHIIGENCLTYEQYFNKDGLRIDGIIGPNSFNYFFLDAAKQYENTEDFNEIKIIQCHYKNKIELTRRSVFGYFFSQHEYESGKVSTQLYVISTYTFYQWRILKLLKDQKLSASRLQVDTLKSLAYAQIPNGQTLLHFIYSNKPALENIMNKLQVLDDYGGQFYIPLLRDCKNYTALDCALNHKKPEVVDYQNNLEKVNSTMDNYDPETVNVANRKTAGIILKHAGTYPYDLFKVHMKELIAPILELGLIEFSEYITNCSKTPSFLRGYDRAKVNVVEECGAQVFTYNEAWPSDEVSFQAQFEDPTAEEKLISIKLIDLAYVHHYTNNTNNQIYQELSRTEDRSIFQNVAIKAMIEQKWSLVQQRVTLILLLPYLVFLSIFTYFTVQKLYSNKVISEMEKENPNIVIQEALMRIGIVLFAIYFFGIEVVQTYREGVMTHLKDFWNYLDLIPPNIILACEIINFSDDGKSKQFDDSMYQRDDLMRKLYSITALAMWLRFLYFFRISRSTGYYISMIVEVITDMGQFFFIFLITVISFAHTFYIYFGGYEVTAMEDDGKSGLIDPVTGEFTTEAYMANFFSAVTYSYRIALGDFDTDNLYAPMAWFFFIIATLFVQIVFLNLLISIVGETFGRVQEDKANMMYQDMADLIVENQFLISETQQAKTNVGKYIFITVPDDLDIVQEEIIQKNFDELKSEVRLMQDVAANKMIQTDLVLDRVLRGIKKLQDSHADLLQEVKNLQQA